MSADDRTRRVLDGVRAIPPGFVRAYSDVDPAAPRLVGRMLATTGDDVPWHRVVRADGSVPMGERQAELLRARARADARRARGPGAGPLPGRAAPRRAPRRRGARRCPARSPPSPPPTR